MSFIRTTATQRLLKLKQRIRGVAGGASASKTVSILMLLIDDAMGDEIPTLTSIVSESMPHLRKGAIRDFLNIMNDRGIYEEKQWNRTDHVYTFPSKSQIEFFSADMPSKVRGPRRQRLFINEANNIPWETYDQLEIRTEEEIWLDWNPTNEFWFYTNIKGAKGVDFIILTYKDNEGLDPRVVESIESRRTNKQWWRVYGLGLLGEVEGKIYRDWLTIDEIPHNARLESYGLDFGYSNDPSALIAVYYYDGGYILDEIVHQKGLSNKSIADMLLNLPKAPVYADSAEPKSIDEIYEYGINILPTKKGPGSVAQGISFVQAQRISATKRSINLLKAYRNYMWAVDKDGHILNEPDNRIHEWSNSMDATRYGMNAVKGEVQEIYIPPTNLLGGGMSEGMRIHG